jgi:hypothetical protein
MLLPVFDREMVGAWIARARAVTVRQLADEVNWVLAARDVQGPALPLGPPTPNAVLISPMESSRAAVTEHHGASPVVEECAEECQAAASQPGVRP